MRSNVSQQEPASKREARRKPRLGRGRNRGKVADAQWCAGRGASLGAMSEGNLWIIGRACWLMAWACMRDTSGDEVERYMGRLAPWYRERLIEVAICPDEDDGPGQTRRRAGWRCSVSASPGTRAIC